MLWFLIAWLLLVMETTAFLTNHYSEFLSDLMAEEPIFFLTSLHDSFS